jgi:hypothetical protein
VSPAVGWLLAVVGAWIVAATLTAIGVARAIRIANRDDRRFDVFTETEHQ